MKKYLLVGAIALIGTAGAIWACCGTEFCDYPVFNSASVTPDTLWPPNHNMVGVTVSADVNWKSPPMGNGTLKIVDIASDEPIDGLGDGDTSPDWNITGDMTAELRAERAGNGDGRVYTIAIEARQVWPCEGYFTVAFVKVVVPHDKGKK